MLTSTCGNNGGVAGRLEKHCSPCRSPQQTHLVSLMQPRRSGMAEQVHCCENQALISYSSNHTCISADASALAATQLLRN
jgi:hypothetical protein